jgi:hypothetical protein
MGPLKRIVIEVLTAIPVAPPTGATETSWVEGVGLVELEQAARPANAVKRRVPPHFLVISAILEKKVVFVKAMGKPRNCVPNHL